MPPTGPTTSPVGPAAPALAVPATPVPAAIHYEPPSPLRRFAPRLGRRGIMRCVAAAVGVAVWLSLRPGGLVDRLRDWSDPTVDLDAQRLDASFPFDEMTGTLADVPADLRALDGKKVRFVGYMFSPETGGLPSQVQYQLVYDVLDRGRKRGPPRVQDRIFAIAPAAVPVYGQYVLAEVVGRFHVRVVRNPVNGQVVQVFAMDVESAATAPDFP